MNKPQPGATADRIQELADQIRESAQRANGSEAQLQGEVDAHLRATLAGFGIDYNPAVNQSLRRSYAASGRPDSLFGHIVLDYKGPGKLSRPADLLQGKRQVVDDYLKPICTYAGELDVDRANKWVGILLDGRDIAFAYFNGVDGWTWTPVRPINRYSVLTLVQYYRALYRKPLDPYLLSQDFGRDSDVAVACIRTLANYLAHPSSRTTMLFKEWRRMFEQVSTYDLDQLPVLAAWAESLNLPCKDDPSLLLYCLHTYYALIVKLLTAELVTTSQQFGLQSFLETLAHASSSDDFRAALERLESGDVYRDLRITNFLEGDFFAWYLPHYDLALENALRRVVEVFRSYEPATPKLSPRRTRDLLKVFYSGVVDQQIRHDLGEYYTPDWLAELTLNRVGYEGQLDASLLDPACGSGTFLVLAIHRLVDRANTEQLSPVETARRILSQIKGFDLNPLAVISARANYLLAISEYLSQYGDDVEIPVYLCDCINIPTRSQVGNVPCLVYALDTELGEKQIALPESLIRANVMGRVLLQAEEDVEDKQPVSAFIDALRANHVVAPHLGAPEEELLARLFCLLQEFKERDWNEIWCRIIKNHFASQTVTSVDYVVGNPPWVRWSRLPRRYRNRCKEFCYYYGLVSGRGYAGGIESDISTVVMYSSVDNWLREGGTIGFLITATVYKSESARGYRIFELPSGLTIYPKHIDDLVSLLPFPDATNKTSLIVARKARSGEKAQAVYPPSGMPYLVWNRTQGSGRVDPRLSLEQVEAITQREEWRAVPIADRGSPLFTGAPADVAAIKPFKGHSPYLADAHKGTTTDAARIYWVKVVAHDMFHQRVKIRSLTPEELPGARVENISTTGGLWVESDLVYPLIRGRDIGKFSYSTDDWYILVPNTHYEAVEAEDEFRRRFPLAHRYFRHNRQILDARSTYQRYQSHLPFYVIYDVGDYTFAPYKVVWMEQQNPKNFRACVIGENAASKVAHRVLVPDHKLYMLSLSDEDEAHFVCGILNSSHLRRILGGFLEAAQIGTSMFRYVGIPRYDRPDQRHRLIAGLSRHAHQDRHAERNTDNLPHPQQGQLDALVEDIFP